MRPALRCQFLLLRTAGLALLLGSVSQVLPAQGRVLTPCGTPRADIANPRSCASNVVRLATRTVVEVDGRVARTTITETFENRGGPLGEADVIYPLPSGAAFEELRLEINGELVRGEVLDATAARATYERIVREQRDPALVEWAGLGLLRTRIFPFGAGERRTVVLRYRSLPPREGDALRVTARLAVGDEASDERTRSDVRLRWRDAALGTPWSPTHDVRLRTATGPEAWREASIMGRAGDVVAYLPLRRDDGSVGVTVLMHDARRDGVAGRDRARAFDRHALVIVSPPRVAPRPLPRDLTLVLDVSGSMRGTKLSQAIAAGHAVLATLGPKDRVRLIAFSDDVRSHAPAPVLATAAARRAAARWLDALEAEGGTNIGDALHAALAAEPRVRDDERTRLPFVLLLTDGQPTVGLRPDAILDSTRAWRTDARVFTFGLGADVDASLVEQLALDGRGAAQFVRPEESIERAVSLVAQRLTAPLLADVQVRIPGGELASLYTPLGTDLMAGRELVFLARYRGPSRATIEVSGVSDGARRQVRAAFDAPASDANAFVPRLWAVQRVAALDAARRRTGPDPELDEELRTLGERFGIPTALTSYLVLEPGASPTAGTPSRFSSVRGGRAAGVQASSAPAPASVAFEAARRSSEQRKAVSMAAADALVAAAESEAVAAGRTRVVNGRPFDLVDSAWVDRRLRDEPGWQATLTVRVRPFSAAWSALAREVPDLGAALALGDRVRVRGARVLIEVAADGRETLDTATLTAVRERW